jgi:flavin reductase (DIM6/NTAB) family NADH-FMN oxidoreductase RutF
MKIQIPPYVHTFPAPAVLIGCGTVETPNLITVSWFGTLCSEPPMVNVSIRPERFSHHLIQESGEFTVNVPRYRDLNAVKHCGTASGRNSNKFKDLALTPLPCPPLEHAPMIAEFFLALACRVKQVLSLGTHDAFVSEIVAIYCDEEKRRATPRCNPSSLEQITYLDGKYWKLAEIR